MLTVVTWLWAPPKGYRSAFGPEQVNVLRRMVARHYSAPHRFVCVTDNPAGLDPGIVVVEDRHDFVGVPNPHGKTNPSCYRRLRLFAPEARDWFGDRFVSLDLDCVLTGDLRPVWDRPEPIVLWGDTNPKTAYNGSMLLMTAGARPQVWTTFDPQTSPQRTKRAGCFGSDQGWISYCLGPREPKWTTRDGVYSFRVHVAPSRRLPPNAKVVMFHGQHDPWDADVRTQHPWVKEFWQ